MIIRIFFYQTFSLLPNKTVICIHYNTLLLSLQGTILAINSTFGRYKR
jgi:hypothetical protein